MVGVKELSPEELEEKRRKEKEEEKNKTEKKHDRHDDTMGNEGADKLNPISYEVISSTGDFQKPKLNQREDTIIIKQVILGKEGKYGEYAMVLTEAGWFRATSTVLLKQLRQIKKYIEALNRPVKARIEARESGSGQRYFTFVVP